MKKFIKNISLFFIPFIVFVCIVIVADFFKIFGFQEYYEGNFVGLNRGMICTKTYTHYREQEQFNSFILGSSRTLSYKCKNWKKYLDKDAVPFHFDASGEGIWGIMTKMEYITRLGDRIDNALIVLDRDALQNNKNSEGHLYKSPPEVSGESPIPYYYEYVKSSVNPKFILAFTDYAIFRKHRNYMGFMIHKRKYTDSVNPVNCDFWFGYDKHIRKDSLG